MSDLEEKIKRAPPLYFLAGGLLLAAVYYMNYYDGGARAEKQISNINIELVKIRKDVADVEGLTSNMAQYEAELNSLAEKFEVALNYLPSQENIYVIIKQLYLEARMNGVNITSVKPSDKLLKQDFYEGMPIDIEFSGTYEQIMAFLTKVVNLPRIINLKELLLSLDTKAGPATTIIKAKGKMLAYRFVEQEVKK
ncbi:MAG: type 4a pilus biogenesis protein PilO [Bdellovibrionales bacterium]|nr:type 4a pilus biogenesis protein PilO [Bdellovibrionales bacterium]